MLSVQVHYYHCDFLSTCIYCNESCDFSLVLYVPIISDWLLNFNALAFHSVPYVLDMVVNRRCFYFDRFNCLCAVVVSCSYSYRITADLQVETDIITNIAAIPIKRADTSNNVYRDLQNSQYCHSIFDFTLADIFRYQSVLLYWQYHSVRSKEQCPHRR
jgi:hypothetical protein